MGRGLSRRITNEKDLPPWLYEKLKKNPTRDFEEFLAECTEILKNKRNPKPNVHNLDSEINKSKRINLLYKPKIKEASK